MHPDTFAALETAEEALDFRQPLDDDGPVSPDVAVRGVPVGLMHSVGTKRPSQLFDDIEGGQNYAWQSIGNFGCDCRGVRSSSFRPQRNGTAGGSQ
ncbi:MAG: hypothetical protein R2843_09450 [Thermomicrobiales bacterium]